jgi:ADP-heptose:LPS heptosyltransferase
MKNDPPPRFTLLSFRTFGDYVLKAPFLHELYREHPLASVTIVTNAKGGQVYPLLDSRLQVVVTDHGDKPADILAKLRRIPRADVVYALDDSRTTILLAALARGKRKTGWVQGCSRLYGAGGFFEWHSVRPAVSAIARLVLRPGRLRLPEDKHDAEVELELLHLDGPRSGDTIKMESLAAFRSPFAYPAAPRPSVPYIYCAAEAGWTGRQLREDQWKGIIDGLLREFPRHSIVVHGASGALAEFRGNQRVLSYESKTIRDLFARISAADLVIAPDSFALHLASFYNVPAIGYFGPAHPHRFRPTAAGSRSLFHQPECSPCLQVRGSGTCAKGLSQCLSLAQMTPEEFIAAAAAAAIHPASS